jgi:hypothetical protein
VEAGEPLATLWNGERELVIQSPVAGTITRVNLALRLDPSFVNRSPYDQGWLAEVVPEPGAVRAAGLLKGYAAARWMRLEVQHLLMLVSDREPSPVDAEAEMDAEISPGLSTRSWQQVHAAFFA